MKETALDDVACTVFKGIQHPTCSLSQEIYRLRKGGWKIDFYHEKQYVLVVKRSK